MRFEINIREPGADGARLLQLTAELANMVSNPAEVSTEIGVRAAGEGVKAVGGEVVAGALVVITTLANVLPRLSTLITAWAERDRRRKITITDPETKQEVTISGMSASQCESLLRLLMRRSDT